MNTLSSSPIFPIPNFRNPKHKFPPKFPLSSSNFHHFPPFLLHQTSIFNVTSAINANNNSVEVIKDEDDDEDLVIEASLTRILPPALTLEHGLESLKNALEEFKLHPPSSTSGLIRFQIAVPPCANALDWFCCQNESSGVFPQFYMSKQSENPSPDSAFFNKTFGVFGIGAAISFRHPSSSSHEWNSIRRYLLVDSLDITAYGFIGVNYNFESSFMKNESGSVYVIIPQIELNECEGFSILAGTLVWSESLGCFEQALHSYETTLFQAINLFPATLGTFCASILKSSIQKFNLVVDEALEMVYMEAPVLGSYNDAAASIMEMKNVSSSSQFCIRLSQMIALSKNMIDDTSVTSSILQDCVNINSVWASLIVEECSRLGLTYFCIAPGSRSSPLAVAASTHPRITCIACYDERSLAFHAMGYARGSQVPAVVITTSGTAVSNLFPAVVEASQDFVPLVLLTADRPSELHAAGANQAIDQVNHFGSYVRFFFNLPAPSDHVTARMVLTTIDSAVYWATCSPSGPVHINCPFREPLDSPADWNRSCLDKLDFWISCSHPFTKYINFQTSNAHNADYVFTAEVEKVIKNSKRGILLVGAIHREDEMWAALLLARHLSWPVVADILSGLRLRKLLTSYCEYEDSFVFIDHFDHVLLSDAAMQWAKPDVILQVGSKITSKRISQFLEVCFPFLYVMVDKHPCRHDPSHMVTHRIQSTISQFTGHIMKGIFPCASSKWTSFLQVMNAVVAWELSFQICSESSLTEPHVAHSFSEVVAPDTVLFIGNSMAIRDADMYSQGVASCTGLTSQLLLPCQWTRVAGNRGASGIDGLLSTAVGFAVGCKKRVICIIGDVSFLHDTNGLAILSSRMSRKPVTVLVINNQGGGIFSLLPIAEKTESEILEKYFYFNHHISFNKLCDAHGVKHLLAETKLELHEALLMSQKSNTDCVIEVSGSINSNAAFHSVLRNYAAQAASHAFTTLSQLSPSESSQNNFFCKIATLEHSLFRVRLAAPPTSSTVDSINSNFVRQGFVIALTLDDGSIGFGEIAPLEIHAESMEDVEEQLRFLTHALKGATISYHVPLLRESFSKWIWSVIGVPPCSVYPSVRCGLEMATLNAIATRQNCTLLGILWPQPHQGDVINQHQESIDICALVDSEGSPLEVASTVVALVDEGFRAVKVKVARRDDPREDVAVIKEIRKRVGAKVELRVDANRRWTYEQAIEFGCLVKDCGLEYIEEPVQYEDDIVKFCEETGLPVALDETVDNIQGKIHESLARFTHPGVVALVIKPSVVGGFENAAAIAWWAHIKGKLAVVSATFESSLGLSSFVQFATFLEMRRAEVSGVVNKPAKFVAHGLGTYKWLEEDITLDPLVICRQSKSKYLGASVVDADRVLNNFQINRKAISKIFVEEHISTYDVVVEVEDISYVIKVQEMGESKDSNALLFLHGFLGTSEDWASIMKALSGSAKCFAVDLPSHGRSKIQPCGSVIQKREHSLSIEVVSKVLSQLINKISTTKVTLVGYSMGARIALYMTLRLTEKIAGAVVISGSPGLKDEMQKRLRAAKDDSRARSLVSFGLAPFLENWYHGNLWKSFREHPSFEKIVANRLEHGDIHCLARSLSDLSIGRQPSLWEELKHCKLPLLFVVGEQDEKFKSISQDICREIDHMTNYEAVEVPNCGHAVHLENPLVVVRLISQFLTKTS